MHINQHLTWSNHCKVVYSRATKLLNLLHCMLFCCSQSEKALCFCALVLSLMQYACPARSGYHIIIKISSCLNPFRIVLLAGYVSFHSANPCMVTSFQSMYVHTWMVFHEDPSHCAVYYFYIRIIFHDYFQFNSNRTCSRF